MLILCPSPSVRRERASHYARSQAARDSGHVPAVKLASSTACYVGLGDWCGQICKLWASRYRQLPARRRKRRLLPTTPQASVRCNAATCVSRLKHAVLTRTAFARFGLLVCHRLVRLHDVIEAAVELRLFEGEGGVKFRLVQCFIANQETR